MKKSLTFDSIINFCGNVYPHQQVVTESYKGYTLERLRAQLAAAAARIGGQTFQQLLNDNGMVNWDNAPANIHRQFPQRWVTVKIPKQTLLKMESSLQFCEGLPGIIIGVNAESGTALVVFERPYIFSNTYAVLPLKYLKEFSVSEFENNYNYSVRRLREVFRGLNFKTSPTRNKVSAEMELATPIGNFSEYGFKINVTSSSHPVGVNNVNKLYITITPLYYIIDTDASENAVELTSSTPEVIEKTINNLIATYKEVIDKALPLSTVYNFIKTVAAGKTQHVRNIDGMLEIKLGRGNRFDNFKSYGIATSEVALADYRTAVPNELRLPASRTLNLNITPYKDKASGKQFATCTWTKSGSYRETREIFTTNSKAYKELKDAQREGEQLPEETQQIINQYSELSTQGKQMFVKYLLSTHSFR